VMCFRDVRGLARREVKEMEKRNLPPSCTDDSVIRPCILGANRRTHHDQRHGTSVDFYSLEYRDRTVIRRMSYANTVEERS